MGVVLPYHPDGLASRPPPWRASCFLRFADHSLRLAARSFLACSLRGHDAVSVARPVLSGHEAMMTAIGMKRTTR